MPQTTRTKDDSLLYKLAEEDDDETLRRLADEEPADVRITVPSAAEKPRQFGGGFFRQALGQGVLMGGGDEAEAFARSLMNKTTYAEELAKVRGSIAEYEKAYPKTAMLSEFAGGVAPALLSAGASGVFGAGRAALTAGGKAGLKATAKELAKRAATQGAVQGGVSGALTATGGPGEEDGIEKRVFGGALGAVTGAITGGALGYGGGKVAERIARRGTTPSPAVETLARLAEEAGMTPEQAAKRATALGRVSKEARIADVFGQPGMRELRRIKTMGGEAGTKVEKAMTERLEGTAQRLQDALTRITKKAPEEGAFTIESFTQQARKSAAPKYDQVYRQGPVVDSELDNIMRKSPAIRSAMRKAIPLMEEEGRPVQFITGPQGQRVPLNTPAFLDYTKKALDDMIFTGKYPDGKSFGPNVLHAAKETRAKFVERLKALMPGYEDALNAYAGPTRLKQAFALGNKMKGKASDEIKLKVASLGTSERELFQRGYLNALRGDIDSGRMTPRLANTRAFEGRMKAVFGADAPEMLNAIRTEIKMSKTAEAVFGRSDTAERIRDMARVGESGAGAAVRAIGYPKYAATEFLTRQAERVARALGKAGGESQRMAAQELLLRPTRNMRAALRDLEREYGARRTGNIARALTGGATGGMAARSLIRGGAPEEQ